MTRMRPFVVALSAAAVAAAAAAQPSSPFQRSFTEQTMRVEFSHSGGPAGERVRVVRIVADGAWPGSRSSLVDDLDLGDYRVEVADRMTGESLYAHGFG